MKLLEKLKWHRIGYVEGVAQVNETTTLKVRSILFVRDPFLWFRTRKVVEIGDRKILKDKYWTSASVRSHDMQVRDWLIGGKIDYVSENGTSKPAKIIRLVK
jgi:hypothetical protein